MKEEKRAKKEEKRARKAEKRRRRADGDSDSDGSARPRDSYRRNDNTSKSPVRRVSAHGQEYRRSRSRSPIRRHSREPHENSRDASLDHPDSRYFARRRSRTPPYYRHSQANNGYDDRSMEQDRERDRHRRDDNTRRDAAYDRRPRRE
ncbi:hypothetical protein BD410DRAFT_116253 [Rickenella mellea]|uniref:Uncharacterized protein n=1 Tax=Rickenella mellea TaxID=50990 RepID=A0A4Y7QAA3_9AGAM|nr:hypothetical protein BD410DRAFT_116253 [Rickenella mellea]